MDETEVSGKRILPFRFVGEKSDSTAKLRYSIKDRAVSLLATELEKYGYAEYKAKDIANGLKDMYQFTHLNPRLLAGAYEIWTKVMFKDMGRFSSIEWSQEYKILIENISGKRKNFSEDTNVIEKRLNEVRKDILRYVTAIKQFEDSTTRNFDLETIIKANEGRRSTGLLINIVPAGPNISGPNTLSITQPVISLTSLLQQFGERKESKV